MKSVSCVYEVYLVKENGNEIVFKFCGVTEIVVFCIIILIYCIIGILNVFDNLFLLL